MRSIQGIKTKLEEISELDAADIMKLRNDPDNNRFLYQKEIILEEQHAWIKMNTGKDDVVNFKVLNINNEFKGTISIYNINNSRGEIGRYIVTNPINAIEAEYLLLKFCFEALKLTEVFCQTNIENKSVWGQHAKLGFREKEIKEVTVGSYSNVKVSAKVQELTSDEFKSFNYEPILKLIRFF